MIERSTLDALNTAIQSTFGKSSRVATTDFINSKVTSITEDEVILTYSVVVIVGGIDPLHPNKDMLRLKEDSIEKLNAAVKRTVSQYEEEAKKHAGAAKKLKLKLDNDSIIDQVEYTSTPYYGARVRNAFYKLKANVKVS